MKRWISSLLIAVLIIFTFTGCGQSSLAAETLKQKWEDSTEQVGPTKEAAHLRKSQGQKAIETIVDPIVEETIAEQIGPTKEAARLRKSQEQKAIETIADPIVEETIVEPVVEETITEPVVKETIAVPVVEETIADPVSETVYITKTGEKYHRDGCRYLSKSKIPIDLADAQTRYSPCSVCDPPQ